MATRSQLGRRFSVAVLLIIAAAVTMLVLPAGQTAMWARAAGALLLLAALGIGVRLAEAPAEQRLHRTVRALEESESRTRAVLDAMAEGMLLTGADGRMLAWNASALRILGIDDVRATDALQEVARRLTDADGHPLDARGLPSARVLRSGQPLTGTVLGLRGETGVSRWLSVNTHPIRRDGQAVPYAVVSIFRDVTEGRRQDEEEAAQAEARELQNRELLAQADALEREQAIFRSLVDTAGSAIVGLDRHGRVFEWNREAEQLYGVPRPSALGMSYTDLFAQQAHVPSIREGIETVLGGEPVRNFVGLVCAKGGESRTVLWNVAPLRFGQAEPVHGLIAIGVDITEREASDERFRILFDRSSDAQLLFDETGVIDCNEATLRMLRYSSKEQVLGRTPTELSPRRQPDGRLSVIVGEQMRQTARVRGYCRFEWVHRRVDGSEFPVEVTLTPVRVNGREVMMSSWHDIAERKAVEDALRAAKTAAESANRTKSEFMTRMNHELRTPLTAIIGFSRVLLQGKEGPLAPGAARYTERIRANGMHLLSLINQILDVAKVEAGRMELDNEPVAVDALVHETLGMLEATAEGKGVALRRVVPARLTLIVTDAGKLRQILINLVANAIKFTAAGEVRVTVEADASGRPTAVVVRDTGIGIPADRVSKVFEPFEQGDSSTRREFGGTGLGLSIVKAFADLIGGEVSVESEAGRGSSFTLHLPPRDAEPAAEPRARSA